MKNLLGIATLSAALLLGACAAKPMTDPAAKTAREQLTELQTDPKLSSMAPVALKEADEAVRKAEVPQKDPVVATQLAYLAQSKVDAARAQALQRYAESQQSVLSQQRDQVRLEARDQELEALRAKLNAKKTDRGMVLTLGDVLFQTGKSDLKPGAIDNLSQLVRFMNDHADSHVAIEGHTDSMGSDESNMTLSQRRADSVKGFLVLQGAPADRITAVGKGEGFPVAGNDTSAGRQQNRRVEIIIENPPQ